MNLAVDVCVCVCSLCLCDGGKINQARPVGGDGWHFITRLREMQSVGGGGHAYFSVTQ